ncbi:YqaJ viral recombinase family protein [Variovorax boronicumulans]|uniref:YqaJ viral recombinase family protein n=1 Tax=Variovorax boronicumulans TaxID=436515 RepID=UPI001C56602C
MEILELKQGSPEWHAHRAAHRNASDAPAMMNCSPYKTRTQLLHEMKTGVTAAVDPATQRRFDAGHLFEGLDRPRAEAVIGEELFPVVGAEGILSASFDGLTFGWDINYEHKTLNDELRAVMVPGCTGAVLPLMYRVQMEQQTMVSGAKKSLFRATKWKGKELVEERQCWYEPDAALAAEILAGWEQFEKDLAAYVPAEPVAPRALGATRERLPALVFEVRGEIAESTLDAYKVKALAVIGDIPSKPETDQQFADAKEDAKFCREIQEAMGYAEAAALGRMVTVDEALKVMRFIGETAKRKAIDLENAVTAEEKRRKQQMVIDAATALREHVDALDKRLGHPYMPGASRSADFDGAIKGKRSVPSMQDAVDSTLAQAKIATNATAERIDANLKHLNAEAGEFLTLFPDVGVLVLKQADDFAAVVKLRVADQRAKDQKKADDLRESLAQEARNTAAAEAQAAAVVQHAVATPPPASPTAPSAAVAPLRTTPSSGSAAPAPAPAAANLLIGGINRRLGYDVNAVLLKQLGFEPVRIDGARRFYRDSDLPLIGRALAAHSIRVTQLEAATA